MKYVIILGDGMADYPIDELGCKTPLMAAHKPHIDALAEKATLGLLQTVPETQSPGSDNTNLSIMGYDPLIYYTGRSPLEAASIGIDFDSNDVTYRCNLVTLSDEQDIADCTMIDYSSGEITTPESTALIEYLAEMLNTDRWQLYSGISYRHCLVLRSGETGAKLTPPHDITGRFVRDYLPSGTNSEAILDIMRHSRDLLRDHPVNVARRERGLNAATSCWMWGEGRKAALLPFTEKTGLRGAVVSAVDLIKGIAICAGMDSIDVEGVTGTIDTNFDGKAAAAIEALKDHDFLYIHLEAPDECGHQGNAKEKTRAIELIDEKIVAPVAKVLEECGEDYVLAILPDHRTPVCTKTHARDPVPFLVYRSNAPASGTIYNEDTAKATGLFIPHGCEFIDFLMK